MLKTVLAENAALRIIGKKDFEGCYSSTRQSKAEYLTKDEFIREQNKIDRKIDRILELFY